MRFSQTRRLLSIKPRNFVFYAGSSKKTSHFYPSLARNARTGWTLPRAFYWRRPGNGSAIQLGNSYVQSRSGAAISECGPSPLAATALQHVATCGNQLLKTLSNMCFLLLFTGLPKWPWFDQNGALILCNLLPPKICADTPEILV